MVAAFGSGAAFSLVSGIGGANPAANAISSGFFLALIQAGSYKVSTDQCEEGLYYFSRHSYGTACCSMF